MKLRENDPERCEKFRISEASAEAEGVLSTVT